MSTTVGRFACKNCGKTFSWKPAIAGKKAKCSCGASVEVPAIDPASVQVSAGDSQGSVFHVKPDEEFDYKKEKKPVVGPPCPSCATPLPTPTSILCTACGYNTKTKKKPGSGIPGGKVTIIVGAVVVVAGIGAAIFLLS